MLPHFVRTRVLVISTLAVLIFCSAALAGTVNIQPGVNIVSLVNSNPSGTTFVIAPGMYRINSPITPKAGDSFIGQTACAPPKTACPAILSGAKLLTSFQRSGNYYYVTGQSQHNAVTITTKQCDTGITGCMYPEDLFFDGKPLLHVSSLSAVVSGTWFFDYGAQTIYFLDNPAGHTVETSFVPAAFQATASNVTIKYLTVQEFSVPVFYGAIGVGEGMASLVNATNWRIQNNEVRLNHGSGITINYGYQILNNYVHTNGNLGISGGATNQLTNPNILVQGNEVSFNDYAHVKPDYQAGGIKFGHVQGVVVRSNYIHNNEGSGIHFDTGNINNLVENNVIADNTEQGVFDEISFALTVRNNMLLRNGYVHSKENEWMYGASILSSVSQNVVAYCNTVEVSAQGGNAMNIIAQVRPGYTSGGNYYHHNTVIFDGDSGWNGAANQDPAETQFFSLNRLDYNQYHVSAISQKAFPWQHANNVFTGLQGFGAEAHGTADTNYRVVAPTVAINSPASGSSVSGTVKVTGTAADNIAIGKVEFYQDWTLKATDSGNSPFTFDWSTNGVAPGNHILAAMAYNTDGVRSCYAVQVTVP
jgi:hypothetical protein